MKTAICILSLYPKLPALNPHVTEHDTGHKKRNRCPPEKATHGCFLVGILVS
jgi:hypothetical protein